MIASVVVTRAARGAPRWAARALRSWLSWFWHLAAVAKIAVTVIEMIALELVVSRVGLPRAEWREIVELVSLGLSGLLIAGILFGRRC
jgi:hypothetical protein